MYCFIDPTQTSWLIHDQKKKNMIAPARDHRIDQLQCKDEVEFVV